MKNLEIENNDDAVDVQVVDAAEALQQAHHAVAFTGAGISVESGVGTFRGVGGLWNSVDPYLFSITYFQDNPLESWRLMKEYLFAPCWKARPCEAHRALARLEQRGIIKAVITQNIDNLHHRAGSQKVIEVHGNIRECICPNCKVVIPIENMDEVQRCKNCFCVMKPNCTLFREDLPREAWKAAVDEMNAADIVLVIGTSGEVYPASNLPGLAVCHGGKIININPMHSNYESIAKISISMKASTALREIENALIN